MERTTNVAISNTVLSDNQATLARLATYLQGYGDLMVRTNDWDPAVLQRFRVDPVVASIGGGIDHKATRGQIEHIAALIPGTRGAMEVARFRLTAGLPDPRKN